MSKNLLIILVVVVIAALVLSIFAKDKINRDSEEIKMIKKTGQYQQITPKEAKKIIDEQEGAIIVDVRNDDEYKTGHIENAVLIPLPTINNEMPKELPDLDATILIYCRSGNRSKQAAQKLADMGYTNIYEFGGIGDWEYGTVK